VSRAAAALLIAMALASSACALSRETSDPDAEIPQVSEACPPEDPDCTVTSSTTSAGVSTPSTSGIPSTSTTTVVDPGAEPPTIHLWGSTVVFSRDGTITVRGWLDRTAEVTVADTQVSVHEDAQGGLSHFDATLELDPGEHAVEVTATDETGAASTVALSVLVDPTLDVRLAHVSDVDLVERTLLADDVEFLTGDDAAAAARQDGVIAAGEELPNDFFLRNLDPAPNLVAIGDPWMVVLQACYLDDGPCVVEQAVGIDDWLGLLDDPAAAAERFGWNWYGFGNSPYWLTIQDGVVVQIRELYLP